MTREVFEGFIAGMGTAEGTRLVVGHWPRSPLGAFTDVMVERADGHRLLLAPSQAVADFVATTYTLDAVRITPVRCDVTPAQDAASTQWKVSAGPLRLEFTSGRRTGLGRLVGLVPGRIAVSPWFCRLTDIPARVVGLRTAGTAGNGRREFYGARDVHAITALRASWKRRDLGELRPVTPPVRFGFGSTPARPSVTAVTTTILTGPRGPRGRRGSAR